MLKEKVYLEPEQVEVTAVLEYYSDAEIKRFFNYSGPGSGMPKTYEEVLSALEMCVKKVEAAVPATVQFTGNSNLMSLRLDSDIVFTMPEDGTPKVLTLMFMENNRPVMLPITMHTEREHTLKGDMLTHWAEGQTAVSRVVEQ